MPASFPFVIDESVPDGNTESARLLDDRIREVKAWYNAMFGIPQVAMQAAIGSTNADGTFTLSKGLVLFNVAADPTFAGQLQRNGARLKYNDGSTAQNLAFQSDIFLTGDNSEPNVNSIATETAMYTIGIPGGSLGTAGFLHIYVEHFILSILSGSSLQLRFALGGGVFYGPSIFNSTVGTVTNVGVNTHIRLNARSSVSLQNFAATTIIGQDNVLFNFGNSGQLTYHRAGQTNINMSGAVNFQSNALWSLSSASNSVSGMGVDIVKTR